MKTLMAALLFVSFSSFAQELDATEVLLDTIAAGTYQGSTPAGKYCEVSIRNLSNKVAVVASTEGLTKRSEIHREATYQARPGQRYFLASFYTTTLRGSTQNIFRTIAVTEKTQYIVVADLIINNREVDETKVECIVNL